MGTSNVPLATYVDGVLRIAFGESDESATRREIDVVIDVDDSGTPIGVEILHLRHRLGGEAAEQFDELARRDHLLIGYDSEADAASIGIRIATGSRHGGTHTSPERAVVRLSANGRVVSIDLVDLGKES